MIAEFGFIIGDIYNDSDILKKASSCADRLLSENDPPKDELIQAIAATGDGHILIGVHDGMVYDGFYDERGELRLSGREEIDKYMSVWAIAATDDGRVLIGGEDPEGGGALYVGSYNISSEALKRHLPEIIEKGESGD